MVLQAHGQRNRNAHADQQQVQQHKQHNVAAMAKVDGPPKAVALRHAGVGVRAVGVVAAVVVALALVRVVPVVLRTAQPSPQKVEE